MSAATIDDSAAEELGQAARMWRLWIFMSWQDIRQRYRGSLLGPLWIAGGIAAASLGAGALYARILDVEMRHLTAFISAGVALWTLISLTLTEACHAFVGAAGLIRNASLPRPVHLLRVLSRNLIVFAHAAVVVAIVFVLTNVPVTTQALLAIPGMLLLVLNLAWVSWFLAILSARFRDIIQITVYALQFAIFVTPIFWYPDLAGRRFAVLLFNPFYHLIEIVRGPLLGQPAHLESWIVAAALAVVGSTAALLSFRTLRHQVAYWV